jgi:hypothetical protein
VRSLGCCNCVLGAYAFACTVQRWMLGKSEDADFGTNLHARFCSAVQDVQIGYRYRHLPEWVRGPAGGREDQTEGRLGGSSWLILNEDQECRVDCTVCGEALYAANDRQTFCAFFLFFLLLELILFQYLVFCFVGFPFIGGPFLMSRHISATSDPTIQSFHTSPTSIVVHSFASPNCISPLPSVRGLETF